MRRRSTPGYHLARRYLIWGLAIGGAWAAFIAWISPRWGPYGSNLVFSRASSHSHRIELYLCCRSPILFYLVASSQELRSADHPQPPYRRAASGCGGVVTRQGHLTGGGAISAADPFLPLRWPITVSDRPAGHTRRSHPQKGQFRSFFHPLAFAQFRWSSMGPLISEMITRPNIPTSQISAAQNKTTKNQ